MMIQTRLKYLLVAVLGISFFNSTAQTKNIKGILIDSVQSGKNYTKLYQYSSNIVKIEYHINQYRNKEYFTQAIADNAFAFSKLIAIGYQRKGNGFVIGDSEEAVYIDGFSNNGYQGLQFALAKDVKIFGGGERALPLNRRGYRLQLYNTPQYGYQYGEENLNFSVPFFISSKGYGIFFDNGSAGYADIGKTNNNIFEAGFKSGQINCYLIFGKDYAEILTDYHQLTGKQPLPPRWAMGNFISRFGYRSEAEARAVADSMKEYSFPKDAIIFDLFWFGDSIQRTLGNLDWINKSKWPNPKKMMADFAADNLKTILITEPFFVEKTKQFKAALPYLAVDKNKRPFILQDFYFGKAGILDVFRKDAQQWIWKTHYQKQITLGVNGWWTDLGEPEKHPNGLLHNLSDLGYSRKFDADEVHNLYGHYWNKMLFENYAKAYPNTRLFHLNRSGFAGSQRFSIFPWTGDVSRSWNGLKAQLPNLLGMSLSGIPYTHSDAGGFTMTDKQDAELYTRWLQLAIFTPIFRPHGTALGDLGPANTISLPSEPALWPEPTRKQARSLIQLRYDLTPYNYTLAYEQAAFGKPLMRPMFYNYPNDAEAYKAAEQYMWGDHILVAPVIEKGAVTKKIYFPQGRWYDFMRNKFYTGNQWVNDSAALNEIPFFVKEGSFIPTVWSFKHLDNFSTKFFFALYFPSLVKTSYTLYDDDGLSKNSLASKQYELIHFTGQKANDKISIQVSSNGGNFKGRPAKRNIRLYIADIDALPKAGTLNGQPLNLILYSPETKKQIQYKTGDAIYYPGTRMLTVVVDLEKKGLEIELR